MSLFKAHLLVALSLRFIVSAGLLLSPAAQGFTRNCGLVSSDTTSTDDATDASTSDSVSVDGAATEANGVSLFSFSSDSERESSSAFLLRVNVQVQSHTSRIHTC
jgi:hypothetical protein